MIHQHQALQVICKQKLRQVRIAGWLYGCSGDPMFIIINKN